MYRTRYCLFALLFLTAAAEGQSIKKRYETTAAAAFFQELKQRNHDPGFSFWHHTPITRWDTSAPAAQFSGYLYNPYTKKVIPGGDLLLLDGVIRRDYRHGYIRAIDPAKADSLTGKNLSIRLLSDPSVKGSDTMLATVRVPVDIHLTNAWTSVPMRDDTAARAIPLGKGSKLYWNADSANKLGVFISVLSSSDKPSVSGVWTYNFTRSQRTILVDDTGFAELPAYLFRNVPHGSLVELTIIRGNWTRMQNRTGEAVAPYFAALSEQRGIFYFE